MEKIYILGNDSIQSFADSIDATLVNLQDTRMSTHSSIHDFVSNTFSSGKIGLIIMDLETQIHLCLDIAMHIRLSLETLGFNALAPIIFMSDIEVDSLLRISSNSQIFLTDSVYVIEPHKVRDSINNVIPLKIENYCSGFLNRINVAPPSYGEDDNHGLANQWGACVMNRLISGEHNDPAAISTAKKELYFKYVLANTVDDIQSLVIPEKCVQELLIKPIDARGWRILFIDDKADKGWEDALRKLFLGAKIDCISESVTSYNEFTRESKNLILYGDYDLYLLDLRLGGQQEERIYDTKAFSGMEILKVIKNVNRGRQVIMFTASNKAWNFKALLDPNGGANGYYIKESPSFKFNESFSYKSIQTFKDEAITCYKRNYLKGFYSFIEEYFSVFSGGNEMFDECKFQVNLAFELTERATTKAQFQYAFISLIQTFEILSKHIVEIRKTDSSQTMLMRSQDQMSIIKVLRIHPDNLNRFIYTHDSQTIFENSKDFSQFEKLAAIYLQYLDQVDDGILYILNQLVQIRNKIMHPNTSSQNDTESARLTNISYREYEEKYAVKALRFQSENVTMLIKEISELSLLKERRLKGQDEFVLDKGIVNTKYGVQLVLECLVAFFSAFE